MEDVFVRQIFDSEFFLAVPNLFPLPVAKAHIENAVCRNLVGEYGHDVFIAFSHEGGHRHRMESGVGISWQRKVGKRADPKNGDVALIFFGEIGERGNADRAFSAEGNDALRILFFKNVQRFFRLLHNHVAVRNPECDRTLFEGCADRDLNRFLILVFWHEQL